MDPSLAARPAWDPWKACSSARLARRPSAPFRRAWSRSTTWPMPRSFPPRSGPPAGRWACSSCPSGRHGRGVPRLSRRCTGPPPIAIRSARGTTPSRSALLGAFAGAAVVDVLTAYLHQAALGMIGAGVRAIPVGHTHGQQVLAYLHDEILDLARSWAIATLKPPGRAAPLTRSSAMSKLNFTPGCFGPDPWPDLPVRIVSPRRRRPQVRVGLSTRTMARNTTTITWDEPVRPGMPGRRAGCTRSAWPGRSAPARRPWSKPSAAPSGPRSTSRSSPTTSTPTKTPNSSRAARCCPWSGSSASRPADARTPPSATTPAPT